MKNQPEAVIPDPQNMCSHYCAHFTGLWVGLEIMRLLGVISCKYILCLEGKK